MMEQLTKHLQAHGLDPEEWGVGYVRTSPRGFWRTRWSRTLGELLEDIQEEDEIHVHAWLKGGDVANPSNYKMLAHVASIHASFPASLSLFGPMMKQVEDLEQQLMAARQRLMEVQCQ